MRNFKLDEIKKKADSAESKLMEANKYETMLRTAAILTKLLERNNVKPIIVGGFSVEIYTNRDYATYDIDIVTSDIATVANTLQKIGFKKEGRHFYHERLLGQKACRPKFALAEIA